MIINATMFEWFRLVTMIVLTYLNVLNLFRAVVDHRMIKNIKSRRKITVGWIRILSTLFFWIPVPFLITYDHDEIPNWAVDLSVLANSMGIAVLIGIGVMVKRSFEET